MEGRPSSLNSVAERETDLKYRARLHDFWLFIRGPLGGALPPRRGLFRPTRLPAWLVFRAIRTVARENTVRRPTWEQWPISQYLQIIRDLTFGFT